MRGWNPEIAAEAGNAEIVQLLVSRKGGNPDAALLKALESDHLDIADTLVAHGARLHGESKMAVQAAIQAASDDNSRRIAWFLDHGVSKNAQDSKGASLLMHALLAEKAEPAELLIDSGARVDLALKNGTSVLHLAANMGDCEILARILPQVRNVDQPDRHGTTALMFAVSSGKLAAVKMLVERGAKPTARRKRYSVTVGTVTFGRGPQPSVSNGAQTEKQGGESVLDLAESDDVQSYLENVLHPPKVAVPDASTAKDTADTLGSDAGSRSPKSIIEVIRQNIGGFKYTYEKYLRNEPGLGGRISLKFTIAPSGDITSIAVTSSNTGNSMLDEEIKEKAMRMKFEQIEKGNVVVTYAFVLDKQ